MNEQQKRMLAIAVLAAGAALALHGCGGGDSSPDAASLPANFQAAWVEIGDGNQAIARVITSYTPPAGTADANAACPQLTIDGTVTRMNLRAAAATLPLRTTASDPVDSKPSQFPVTACEVNLPAKAQLATVFGKTLPLPKADPQRVLVLADTGCRLKKSTAAWQACSDAAAWPLANLAATAAAMNPDLVLHIGDYHYRENVCPPDVAGCQGSPWGYGWDTWQADLFTPAAPLLAAAPWIVVRGNHEECARAGQGWFRFMDTQPYTDARSCNDPANDTAGNYSAPYAVTLGSGSQIVVFDSAKVGSAALKPTDAQFAIYQPQFQAVAAMAAKAGMVNTIFTNHHPILAFAPIAGSKPVQSTPALLSVLNSLYPQTYYPPGVNVALHGHVHDFQAINFSTGQTATIVSGNGGDNLDLALPDPLPPGTTPAAGATIDKITHHSSFGFMMMERQAAPATGWNFKAYTVAGKLLATCQLTGSALSCDKTGFLTP